MKVYNTKTRSKEKFESLQKQKVSMYVCGVTPYDYAHIGNARPAIVFDTLYRFFRSKGLTVTYLRNFTDIDDKIIDRSNALGVNWKEHTQKYIDIYHSDMKKLNVLNEGDIGADGLLEPRVTTHIPEIIQMIVALLEKKHAYVGKSGDVLYDTTTFPEYGQLSGKKLDELIAGMRVEVSDDKKNPTDFVLWKSSKPNEPKWEFDASYPTVNAGRPGWHIECSAMVYKEFGNSFDIHGGGEDLKFPHHECEVAQSKGACGGHHARYWMHNAFINVNGEKMSKSLGNFKTIHGLLEKYSGEALRLWMLSTHYRKPIDLTEEALDAAKTAVVSLMRALVYSREEVKDVDLTGSQYHLDVLKSFDDALLDDLNTAKAVSYLHNTIKAINIQKTSLLDENEMKKLHYIFYVMADVLGFETISVQFQETDADIDALVEQRTQAKADKNWAEADRLRDELTALGVLLEDSKEGTKWRRK